MNTSLNVSKRERYLVIIEYLVSFTGLSILDYLEGMSKNTEFMSFHRKEAIRIGKFVLAGLVVFALFFCAYLLLDFSRNILLGAGGLIVLYILFSFFLTFKGMYYAFHGQTKKVF